MGKVATEIAFLTSLGNYYDTTVPPVYYTENSTYRYVKILPSAYLYTLNVKFTEDGTAYVSDKSLVAFKEGAHRLYGHKIYIIKESCQTANRLFNFMPTTRNKKSPMTMHTKGSVRAKLHCLPYHQKTGIRWNIKRW